MVWPVRVNFFAKDGEKILRATGSEPGIILEAVGEKTAPEICRARGKTLVQDGGRTVPATGMVPATISDPAGGKTVLETCREPEIISGADGEKTARGTGLEPEIISAKPIARNEALIGATTKIGKNYLSIRTNR